MIPDFRTLLYVLAIVLGIPASLVSIGVLTMVWKISWAMRGYIEAEHTRANTNMELVALVGKFMEAQRTANEEQRRANEAQRDMNKNIWVAIQVHGMRLNNHAQKIGAPVMGENDAVSH